MGQPGPGDVEGHPGMAFPWGGWLALNVGVLLVSWLVLLAPSAIVTQISPAKVMHFE